MRSGKCPAFAACLLVLVFGAPLACLAQDGEISGNVQAAGTSQPPEGTLLTLSSDAGEIIQQQTPQGGGRFQFSYLRRGVYYVSARAPGYREASQRADIFSIKRISVYLTLFPDRPPPQAVAPARDAIVDERQLRIPREARKEFEEGAQELLERKNPEASLAYFRKAVETYPEYYEAYYLMGTAYMDLQKWPEAEEALERSVELHDRQAASYLALGTVHNRQGRPADAAPVLERGVELNGNAWQGHFELAQSYLALGRVEEAEKHARRARELEPGQPLVRLLLGNVLLRRNDLAGARLEYKAFLEAAPASAMGPEVRGKIAQIDRLMEQPPAEASKAPAVPRAAQQEFSEGRKLLEQRELEPALAHFRKATEIHPQYVEAHHMQGAVLLERQDTAGAELAFRRGLEINSSFAPSYVGLGMVYNTQQKPAEAAAMLQRAVELEPNAWQGHFELARTQLALRQPNEAETHAQQAHELAPKNPMVHVLLGNVFLAERRLSPARQEFQHYVELAPNGPLAPQLKAKIKDIDSALASQPTAPPN